MDTLVQIIHLFLIGLKDCFVGVFSSLSLRKHERFPELLKKFAYCVGLNGIALVFVVFMFETLILPLVQGILGFAGATAVWGWLHPFLNYAFDIFWILPLLILSKLVNCVLYQSIADKTFDMYHGRRRVKTDCRTFADIIAGTLVQLLFLVQSFMVSLFPIPLLGELLTIIHLCLLYSLYAFDYKWINMGKPLHQRLDAIDYNWPYFIGFGFPLAIMTMVIRSFILEICIFSVVFPLYVVSSTICTPTVGQFKFRPHFFSPVNMVLNFLTGKIMFFVRGR